MRIRSFAMAAALFALTSAATLAGTAPGLALAATLAPTASSVGSPINITRDDFANNEESLGMSANGQLLAGAWNDWEYNDGCGFSYSTDGGSTWAPETFVPGLTQFTNDPNVPGTGRFFVAGDPAVAYNPRSGVFDVVCQSFGTKTGNQIQLLATTFDSAKANPNADVNSSYGLGSWSLPAAPVAAGKSNGSEKGSNGQFPDHESITVDTSSGPGHHYGREYVAWAEFSGFGKAPIDMAYSDNDGRTWTGPIHVSDAGHQFNQDARLSVAPDGTLTVTYINSQNENALDNNTVMASRSTDGGNTWGPSHPAATIVTGTPGLLPNSDYRVFADAWSVTDSAGRVVVAYTDQKSGASQVYAVHTLAPGDLSHWSAPLRVKPSAREQFFPWISAAPNGRVDVVFYDRTCDPADVKNCVTLASSADSGGTWGITAVTTKGFDGDKFQACLAFVDPQPLCGNPFLGDYIAVASNDATAQILYTGNGQHAMDVFSQRASF